MCCGRRSGGWCLCPAAESDQETIDVVEGAARRARSVVVGDRGRPDAHRRDRHVSAHTILTEAFPDRSAFPDEEHFAIWPRLTPSTAVSKGNSASRTASVLRGGGSCHRVQARETGLPGVALQGTDRKQVVSNLNICEASLGYCWASQITAAV